MSLKVRIVTGIALSLAATTTYAGSITGRVTVTGGRSVQKSAVDPYPASIGALHGSHQRTVPANDPRDVVLYLEGTFPQVERGSRPTPSLTQVHQSFRPRVLGIAVGTLVHFPNEDRIFHNVFSYSKAKRFDLGYYGGGKSKAIRFDRPGLVKVFCDIHSNMSAFIYVVDSPFVTQPDSDGNFKLDGVPDGEHTLTVWHPDRPSQRHRVTVSGDGARVDVSL